MREILFRCSSIGKLMTEPKSIDPALITPGVQTIIDSRKRTDEDKAVLEALKLRTLSEGAKTYIRELVCQEIWGVDFEVSSKYTDKGLAVEAEALELLNRVRGLALVKNTERRSDDLITGEADTVDLGPRRCGHDIKSSWSLQTFPAFIKDCEDPLYAWQMRGYMRLWDLERWEVNYVMVDTPEELLGQYEPRQLHLVGHLPEHLRLTTWAIERDRSLERQMDIKLQAARKYYAQCIEEFAATHPEPHVPTLELPAGQPEQSGQHVDLTITLPEESPEPAPLMAASEPDDDPASLTDDKAAEDLVSIDAQQAIGAAKASAAAEPAEDEPIMTLGQINTKLEAAGLGKISAATLEFHGIPFTKERAAVQIQAIQACRLLLLISMGARKLADELQAAIH